MRISSVFDHDEAVKIMNDGDVYRFYCEGTHYDGAPDKARNSLRQALLTHQKRGAIPANMKIKTRTFKDFGGYVDAWTEEAA